MGALITILTIGVGPVMQQMPAVVNRRLLSDRPASTARGQTYPERGVTSNISSATSETIPSSMLSSIFAPLAADFNSTGRSGKTSSTPDSSIKPDCATGDCDIPPFRSLAACSHCDDISEHLSSHCEECRPGYSSCYHFLPNGLQLNLSSFNSPDWNTSGSDITQKNYATDTGDAARDMQRIANIESFGDSAILHVTAI
ncbi:hypothetical protein BBP40_003404 [Aspergillus hancockii]|nr:hypothetical protein BBP40_003404 [Aspergillus hancockii]